MFSLSKFVGNFQTDYMKYSRVKFDIVHSLNWRRGSAANAQIRQENIIPYRKEKGNKIHYGTCHIMKIDAFKRNREMLGVRTIAWIGKRRQTSIHPSSGFSTDVTQDGI